jgi:SnoaL-like domain
MHPHEALINQFYTAFQRKDAAAMGRCYHSEIVFNDPAFVNLRGKQAGLMWQMLCERGKDLVLSFGDVQADDEQGKAHWEARYTFTGTGRKVHNIIEARFKFKDGLVVEHSDQFSFWRWSSQALGPTGMLLGWSPFLRGKVQQQSKALLLRYIEKQA